MALTDFIHYHADRPNFETRLIKRHVLNAWARVFDHVYLLVEITNIYPDDTVVVHEVIQAPKPGEPSDAEDWEDWADEYLLPHTGTGRTEGDASYFVEVLDATDRRLIGARFEWGV